VRRASGCHSGAAATADREAKVPRSPSRSVGPFTNVRGAEESESPKVQVLLALREIEFDRATGKLSDENYEVLKAKYSRLALDAMDVEEGAESGAASDAAEELIRQAARAKTCPNCGVAPSAARSSRSRRAQGRSVADRLVPVAARGWR
jgi:hypothetical protein